MVEDNAGLRRIVVRQLSERATGCWRPRTRTAAMAIIDCPERMDLLFTDVVMPGAWTGLIWRASPRSRRPMLRNAADLGLPRCTVERASRRTGGRLLSKPYRKEELRRAVREVLDEPR